MTTTFTRTTKANEITVTYEVTDRKLDESILDVFEKLRSTDDCSDGSIRVHIYKGLSERAVVRFDLSYDHGEYEALVSKETKELLGRLFDLEKEMRDLDNLI
jgi:hypothetical protein